MVIGQLIAHLKHGRSYTANDENGNPYNVLEPPNKYMLSAAKVIEKIVQDNNTLIEQVLRLQQELDNAQAQIQHFSRVSEHGATAGSGSTDSGASERKDDAGLDGPTGA